MKTEDIEATSLDPMAADADALAARYAETAGFSPIVRDHVANEYEDLLRDAYRMTEEFN